MEHNIAKWYQSCGVYLSSPEQYDKRIQGVKKFTGEKFDISTYCELVKAFMKMSYDIKRLSGFVETFNGLDISFSEENVKEIPLLAGICIYDCIENKNYNELGVMISLAYERGNFPYQKEIYELIMEKFENNKIMIREESEWQEVKTVVLRKATEEEKADWNEGVNYVASAVAELNKFIKTVNTKMSQLENKLRNREEEMDLLWWLVADWSEIFECSLEELSDKQAAIAVPLELMWHIKRIPGPLAIKQILQKALLRKDWVNEYSVRDYIAAISDEVLESNYCVNYDTSLCIGFVPILELLQARKRFSREDDLQMVYRIFEERYEVSFLEEKISIINFANQLYLECELLELI